MKPKVLTAVIVGVLVITAAALYTTGSLGSLQGRFGGTTGGVTIALASDTPREDIVVAGDADVEVSKYTLSATKEDFVVTELQINNRGTSGDMDNNISSVSLSYEDSTGSVVEERGYLSMGVATFSGLDLYVQKDDTAELTILVDLNSVSSGATAGEKIQLYVSATGFEAVGQTSGKTATNWTGSAPSKPALMHVYETKPTLSLASSSPSGGRTVSASDDVFTFTVAADSSEDVIIRNLRILLTSDSDFATTAVTSATLRDSGSTVGSASVSFTDSSNAYVQFNFKTALEVAKGTTKTYTLRLDTAAVLDEDSGVDDPLAVSINLGSSSNGTVSPGGLKWYDTNIDVTWVGNVTTTTLTGNTLTY